MQRENYALDPAAEMHSQKENTPTSRAEDLTGKKYILKKKKKAALSLTTYFLWSVSP